MAQTNILLEAGTNELEVVEFYLDEIPQGGVVPSGLQPAQELADAYAAKEAEATGEKPAVYRGYYGVNVAKVLEIIRMPKVTELPEVQHPSVMGAFNLRSRIIPLVDLTMWLGKVGSPTPDAKTIVTEFNNVTTAFMVSGVNRIHRISWEEVEPPNKYVAAVTQSTIVGVVKLEGRIVFLLDLEKIVANLNPKLGLNLNSLGDDWDASKGYRALISDDSALVREMQRDLLEKAEVRGEIMTANITADILCRLSESIPANLREGGTLILSGIIEPKLGQVVSAYEGIGLKLLEQKKKGEWYALAFRK